MKTNIAKLRSELSKFLDKVQKGEEIEIQKHNITIAKIVSLVEEKPHKTKLGVGSGTVRIKGDLTEPMIESSNWEMLKRKPS